MSVRSGLERATSVNNFSSSHTRIEQTRVRGVKLWRPGRFDMPMVFTYPNADTNGRVSIRMIEAFSGAPQCAGSGKPGSELFPPEKMRSRWWAKLFKAGS